MERVRSEKAVVSYWYLCLQKEGKHTTLSRLLCEDDSIAGITEQLPEKEKVVLEKALSNLYRFLGHTE